MSFWCPVSVWDMGTHPKVGHVSSSTSSQTTVDMVCDQFWELWLSSSCCRNCFCPNEFSKPASLIWLLLQGPIWYFCNSEYVAVVSALISCFLRYYENSSDMCSPPLSDPVPWSSSQFYFLQRLWILWIFQRFRFVFHKVRKAVARVVVHKGD